MFLTSKSQNGQGVLSDVDAVMAPVVKQSFLRSAVRVTAGIAFAGADSKAFCMFAARVCWCILSMAILSRRRLVHFTRGISGCCSPKTLKSFLAVLKFPSSVLLLFSHDGVKEKKYNNERQ
jgi:hypothetical protein